MKPSMISSNPALFFEWDLAKNTETTPESATVSQKVWWLCSKDNQHNWKTTTASRLRGSGCPYCSGRKAVPGVNDLPTLYPDIASQWHPTLNNEPTAIGVSPASSMKAWWQCLSDKRHTWQTTVYNRKAGSRCPVCLGQKVMPGINSLQATHPDLAAQLSNSKNIPNLSETVSAGSNKKAWWQCQDYPNHEWQTTIASRVAGRRCPYCSSRILLPGFNDLASKYPDVVKQWHHKRNGILTAEQVMSKSDKKVWWQCSTHPDHEWEASISSRTKMNAGCPFCSNRKVIEGYNDLQSISPAIAKEWHPELNQTCAPNNVSIGSDKKVWWQCFQNENHVWESWVYARSSGKGCPFCAAGRGSSKMEKEITQLLDKLGVPYETSKRGLLDNPRHELDIWIPHQRIAFEINGTYWHSEAGGKDKNYHAQKWEQTKRRDIKLYQLWSDDWKTAKEIVICLILSKIGLLSQQSLTTLSFSSTTRAEKINARGCTVSSLAPNESAKFLEQNHIQGKANATVHLGLIDKNGNIRAVLSATNKKSKNEITIDRYATHGIVRGGFSKLLSRLEKEYPLHKITTFADNSISGGELYHQNGFIIERLLPPDYSYLVNDIRRHKFNYRLDRFKKDPDLIYKEGMSEFYLANLNGLVRVWDSGKTKYVKRKEAI